MDPSCIGKALRILAKTWLAYIVFSIIFLKCHLPKILGNTLIMRIIGIFGNLAFTFVKRVGYPLCWWSYPSPSFIIPFIYPLSKLTVPVSTTQGKMRFYLHIRVNFSTLLIKKILQFLQSSEIWKMLILYIFFLLINSFYSDFSKVNFFILQ